MFMQKFLFAQTKRVQPMSMFQSAALRSFGGGGAIVKADGSHKFIAPCNKKTFYFDNMKPTANWTHEVTNHFRHHNDLPLIK